MGGGKQRCETNGCTKQETCLGVVPLFKLLERGLEDGARVGCHRLLLLELGPLDPSAGQVVAFNVPLEHAPRPFWRVRSELQPHVTRPAVVVWFPLCPAIEEGACTRNVPQHLLHVNVLEPELVESRHESHRTVPDVPRRVDVTVAHLHLGVLEPDVGVAVVDIDRSLIDRAAPVKVALRLFKRRVLEPRADRVSVHTEPILKVFAFPHAVDGEFLGVHHLLRGRAVRLVVLTLARFAKDLLRRDLHRRRLLVLHSLHRLLDVRHGDQRWRWWCGGGGGWRRECCCSLEVRAQQALGLGLGGERVGPLAARLDAPKDYLVTHIFYRHVNRIAKSTFGM